MYKALFPYYLNYLYPALFAFLSIGVFAFAIIVSRLLQRYYPYQEKLSTYECGMPPFGGFWTHTHVRYYIFAFLFLIFDVETVFMYPWALVLEEVGKIALVEMIIFVVILFFGLIYAWRKGMLKWI